MSTTSPSIEDLLKKTKANTTSSGASGSAGKTKKGRKVDDVTVEEKLEQKLGALNIGDEEAKIQQQASELGLTYIDLTEFPISGEALWLIPDDVCKKEKVVCFVYTGEQVRLATTDPKNAEIEKIKTSLEESLHVHGELYLISERNLKHALEVYAKLPKYKPAPAGVQIDEAELDNFQKIATDFKALNDQIQKVNTSEMVTLIIAASIQAGSSDIHVEAEETDVKVRFRLDGLLRDVASVPKSTWPKVISRIKLLSGLKLNITDKPQDGRFTITTAKEKIDVRVSCLPTTWGESVVMRLLKASTASLNFEDLGIIGKAFDDLKKQIERPNGMIITTGPTGSGKTTTLYAMLNKLNQEATKIITLEDPVEYKLEGINQSQIDHSAGYSFADGLRSILRQDPDIVMVGEMRDLETAEVAINAALTGHLVISTIHTNSAAGAIPRFLAMNVKPFLLAPALNAVMGQRLVRRICEKCKQEIQLAPDVLERVKKTLDEVPTGHQDKQDTSNMKFYSGKGCEACNNIGYKGRVGIYEILAMTPEIEKVILGGQVSEYDMQAIAVKNGMITMVQDGLIKALKGMTSVEEVFRVAE